MKSTKIIISEDIKQIFRVVQNAGYEIYLVGGTVRDFLDGKQTKDIDFTTSAKPMNLKRLFVNLPYKIMNYGEKHGTISLYKKGKIYEITTYRKEGKYSDGRRPDTVEFVEKLTTDLARRDFTINALAADEKGNIIDYHNGIEDFQAQIIRAVGNPYDRFEEDSLRILRAVRFALKLGFEIEEKTHQAMVDQRFLLEKHAISGERILQELTEVFDYTSTCFNLLNNLKILDVLFKDLAKYNNQAHLVNIAKMNILEDKEESSWLLVIYFSLPKDKRDNKQVIKKISRVIFSKFPGKSKYFVEYISTILRSISFTFRIITNQSIYPRQLSRWYQYSPQKLPSKPQFDPTEFFTDLIDFTKAIALYIDRIDAKIIDHTIQKVSKFLQNRNIGHRIEEIKVDGNIVKSLGFQSVSINSIIQEIQRLIWQINSRTPNTDILLEVPPDEIKAIINQFKKITEIDVGKLRRIISEDQPLYSIDEDDELLEMFQNYLSILLFDQTHILCRVDKSEKDWFNSAISGLTDLYDIRPIKDLNHHSELYSLKKRE